MSPPQPTDETCCTGSDRLYLGLLQHKDSNFCSRSEPSWLGCGTPDLLFSDGLRRRSIDTQAKVPRPMELSGPTDRLIIDSSRTRDNSMTKDEYRHNQEETCLPRR